MTVALMNKPPLIVPAAVLRQAGFKRGQDLEIKATGGVVTIVPKLMPDQEQDQLEIGDSKIRALTRAGYIEFLAGKTRPIGEFFEARAARVRKLPRRLP